MNKKRIAAGMIAVLMAVCILITSCTGDAVPPDTSTSTSVMNPGTSSGQTVPSAQLPSTGSATMPTGTTSPTDPTNVTVPPASSGTATPSDPEMVYVNVIFIVGEGMDTQLQTVELGSLLQQPVLPEIPGKYFAGWYTDSDCVAEPFDFTQPVYAEISLYAKWAIQDSRICYSYAGYESAAFEWKEENPAACKVSFRPSGSASYMYVDAPLIRTKDSETARVDILGLLGGGSYDFRIETSSGETIHVSNMRIASYDRSGYAHFGYSQGVGAYQDDGSLKQGALVIYLTEDNKNDLLSSAYVDGKQVDIRPYMKNGQCKGIGEMLNNRRYVGADRFDVGIAKLCQVYGAVTIRVIGKVTAQQKSDGTSTIVGLTDYSSTGNGGSPGDNGRMARMVDAKNLTIEGVGEDACIYGWGVHFIASGKGGESFEVRNLRFEHYPEDAVGMEGQQDGSTLTNPVQRCWIHHNSFYPGYCANPAESDKAEGDGSCDFKRGRYYTLSYNYFVDCHKTNLVGSSDSSLQYDITFHHNYWENCGSRIPLLRNANLHFYNNYICNDITMDTGVTGSQLNLSYVSSVRANSFLFAESNYYDGCKNIVLTQSGGVVKAYNNTYYACYEEDMSHRVTDREDKVSNNCQYAAGNIDYSSFDTDPVLFYYNVAEKSSDCYMTDAVTARLEVIQKAGAQKRNGTQTDTAMNQFTPTSAVQMENGELNVSFSGITAGTTMYGIYFNGKGSSSGIKGKHQVVTFTLLNDTQVRITVAATGKDVNLGELVDNRGKVWAGKFTQFDGTLPAGTYFIGSGSKDKEVTITALSFKDGMTPEQKIALAIAAIDSIPQNVTLTAQCKAALDHANAAYQALTAAQQSQVTNAKVLTAALRQYADLQQDQVQKIIDTIRALPKPETATTEQALNTLYARYDGVREQYALLTVPQQEMVTNYQVVTDGLQTLETMRKPYELKRLLNAVPATVTSENVQQFLELKALYDSLEAGERNLNAAQQSKYDDLLSQYQEMQKRVIVAIFTSDQKSLAADAGFSVTNGNYKTGVSFVYEGMTYNRPLKMESKTVVTFTANSDMTLKLKVDASGVNIKIDGTKYAVDAEGFLTVRITAGTHTITKADTCNLCYVILTPAP